MKRTRKIAPGELTWGFHEVEQTRLQVQEIDPVRPPAPVKSMKDFTSDELAEMTRLYTNRRR